MTDAQLSFDWFVENVEGTLPNEPGLGYRVN